jgi:hypothetical protein
METWAWVVVVRKREKIKRKEVRIRISIVLGILGVKISALFGLTTFWAKF